LRPQGGQASAKRGRNELRPIETAKSVLIRIITHFFMYGNHTLVVVSIYKRSYTTCKKEAGRLFHKNTYNAKEILRIKYT
jgi:hypothetical protein